MARLLEALKRIESSQTALHGRYTAATGLGRPSDEGRMASGLAADGTDERAADNSPGADSKSGSPDGGNETDGSTAPRMDAREATFQLAFVPQSHQSCCTADTAHVTTASPTLPVPLVAPFAETVCIAVPKLEASEQFHLPGGTKSAEITRPPLEERLPERTGMAETLSCAQQRPTAEEKQREVGWPCARALPMRDAQITEQRYDPYAERPQDGPHAQFGRQGLAVMAHSDPRQVAFSNLAAQIIGQLAGCLPAAVVFTSPSDGTGTTRTVLPLADALSRQLGGPLLLVDADYRKADLTARGGVYDHRGLWDAIRSPSGWQLLVCRTDLPGVFLLPGAKQPAETDASTVLGFRALLQEVAQHYRLVLVDAPSLAHQGAVLLSKQCDGLYLVARLQYTSARALGDAAQLLRNQQVRLLGCVVLEA